MKPFNSFLKDLTSEFKAKFIDNHDSFVMAPGELPFEYIRAERVNLKLPGTRLLVQKIKKKLPNLPSTHKSNQTRPRDITDRQNRSNLVFVWMISLEIAP